MAFFFKLQQGQIEFLKLWETFRWTTFQERPSVLKTRTSVQRIEQWKASSSLKLAIQQSVSTTPGRPGRPSLEGHLIFISWSGLNCSSLNAKFLSEISNSWLDDKASLPSQLADVSRQSFKVKLTAGQEPKMMMMMHLFPAECLAGLLAALHLIHSEKGSRLTAALQKRYR